MVPFVSMDMVNGHGHNTTLPSKSRDPNSGP
jgi:hypothetical protein